MESHSKLPKHRIFLRLTALRCLHFSNGKKKKEQKKEERKKEQKKNHIFSSTRRRIDIKRASIR